MPNSFVDIDRFLEVDQEVKYKYCVSEIGFSKSLWSSQTDKGLWLLVKDADGNILLPIWPNFKIANNISKKIDNNSITVSINLEDFKDKWLSGLIKDKYDLAVFPAFDEEDECLEIISVTPLRFMHDIMENEFYFNKKTTH